MRPRCARRGWWRKQNVAKTDKKVHSLHWCSSGAYSRGEIILHEFTHNQSSHGSDAALVVQYFAMWGLGTGKGLGRLEEGEGVYLPVCWFQDFWVHLLFTADLLLLWSYDVSGLDFLPFGNHISRHRGRSQGLSNKMMGEWEGWYADGLNTLPSFLATTSTYSTLLYERDFATHRMLQSSGCVPACTWHDFSLW